MDRVRFKQHTWGVRGIGGDIVYTQWGVRRTGGDKVYWFIHEGNWRDREDRVYTCERVRTTCQGVGGTG